MQNIWGQEGKQVMGLSTHRWWPWLLWLALNLTLKPQDGKFPNLLCKLPFKITGHLLTKNREEKNQDCNPLARFLLQKITSIVEDTQTQHNLSCLLSLLLLPTFPLPATGCGVLTMDHPKCILPQLKPEEKEKLRKLRQEEKEKPSNCWQ